MSVNVTHQWSHGLCGCFDNWSVCCIAFWNPSVSFGQLGEFLGKDCLTYTLLYQCCWPANFCFHLGMRRQIRDMRGIPGTDCGDCCLIFCCLTCTLVQEVQEAELIKRELGTGGFSIHVQNTTNVVHPIGGPSTNDAFYPETSDEENKVVPDDSPDMEMERK